MQYQKNLTLRNGTPCVLRNAGADDAEPGRYCAFSI